MALGKAMILRLCTAKLDQDSRIAQAAVPLFARRALYYRARASLPNYITLLGAFECP